MTILLIIIIIFQFMFIYKQNMDATLLKNELSSLKVELLSTQGEVKKLIVSLENSANLAQKSSTVSDIIISDPSLFTYQNGMLLLGVVLVCALGIYSVYSLEGLGEVLIDVQSNLIEIQHTQVDCLESVGRHAIHRNDGAIARLASQQYDTKTEIISHMDKLWSQANSTPVSTFPFDTVAAAALQNPITGAIVEVATTSL